MTGIAQRVVMISVALLPARVRERYREQWMGELRDAPELGIRSSEIAMGSLAFAATFARSAPARRRPSPQAISRPARLSIALAASAAVLAFSQNASAPWNAQTGTDGISAAVGFVWAVLTIYVVVAPLAALLTVLATRGMNGWTRGAVVILAALCTLPLTPFIKKISTSELAYLPLATIALPALGFLVALVALGVTRRAKSFSTDVPSRDSGARLGRASVAGGVVAIIVGGGFAALSILWDSRIPLLYGGPKPSAEFDQWLAIKTFIEHTVAVTLDVWLAVGLVLACAVAGLTSNRRATLRRAVALTAVASSAVVLSVGSLLSFLQFMLPSIASSFPIGLGTEVAEIGLVVLLLVVASGKRTSAPVSTGSDLAADVV